MNKLITKILGVIALSIMVAEPIAAKVYDYSYNNKVTLLEDPRVAVSLKMEMVKKARHHVHIMTYYWDNNGYPLELMKELAAAHARGVDVRIMTTYIPSKTMDFFGKAKKILVKGSDKNSDATLAYMKMGPGPGNNQAWTNNIHEKVFLVDGKQAILGGRNISDNDYRAKDLEVLLEGDVVNQVQSHFELMFSFLVKLRVQNKCRFASDACALKFNKTLFTKNDQGFYPQAEKIENGVKARILTNEILNQQYEEKYFGEERFFAKDDIIDTIVKTDFKHLRGYNYFILPTKRYKAFLEKSMDEGKKIELITNSRETAASISDTGYLFGLPEMLNFVKRGMRIHQWLGSAPEEGHDHLHYLHEKVMLFDEDHAIVGSHNFGTGSTSVSSEIAVEFYSEPVVKRLIEVFDEEINNQVKTAESTVQNITEEIKENRFMIKMLHMFYVRNIIRELY